MSSSGTELDDGRTIAAPLELIARGEGIHWRDLNEDMSVESLPAGRKSGETQKCFGRWLQRKKSTG